ncbi:MAG: ribose transport system ATP-binding protein [Frankiales bacterium]|jgi:ribose transport system ATP-binding protein|nr:ribose transport system ATP-binding protein [Frankiales bacterium]
MKPATIDGPRTAVAVRGLSKRFGNTQALDNVDLQLTWGEVHALVGGNGSGKSTLIKILAGVLSADEGALDLDDVTTDLTGHRPEEAARAGFRFVHQDLGVFPILSVADNLGLGGQFVTGPTGSIRARASRERVREVLRRLDLDVDPQALASTLSMPQRALLAIGRALQDVDENHRAILVLDEPTAALPAEEAGELLRTLRRLADAGHSVVLVSHRLDEVRQAADRVTCLRDGRNAGTLDAADLTEPKLVELILGGKINVTTGGGRLARSEAPVLELRHVSAGPVRDVSFTLRPGEIVGIAGLLGSGRTELLEAIFGVRRISSGDLVVRGETVRFPTSARMKSHGVAFVPEDRGTGGVFPEHSVATNMTVGQSRRYFRRGWFRRRLMVAEVTRDLTRYSVKAPGAQAGIETLSGGNQQKVVLGRWLRTDPAILLLDEPTQGIDVGAREAILGLIAEASRKGMAVVLASSEFEELTRLSDRILVLCRGQVTQEVHDQTTAHELLEIVLENQRLTR